MPSAAARRYGGINRPVQGMPYPASYRAPSPLISPLSWEGIGEDLTGLTNGSSLGAGTYPAASRVLAFPFVVGDYYLVRKVWWANGATATTDSADVGVYTEAGTTLLVSAGSTAIANASVLQEVDVTDTLLAPGRYWCAYVQGGTTATPLASTASGALFRACGAAQMAGSGSTLGSTFTPAGLASNYFPLFGIANRTQVA